MGSESAVSYNQPVNAMPHPGKRRDRPDVRDLNLLIATETPRACSGLDGAAGAPLDSFAMQWQNAEVTVTRPDGACECGLHAGPRECAALRDALLARDFEQPMSYWRYHRISVDAYCLQHASYVKSAKSFAAHIGGLCIALEHRNVQHVQEALVRWLNSPTCDVVKPPLPEARGELTIDHVTGIDDPAAYGRRVGEWANSVWMSYASCHTLANEWVRRAGRHSYIGVTHRDHPPLF